MAGSVPLARELWNTATGLEPAARARASASAAPPTASAAAGAAAPGRETGGERGRGERGATVGGAERKGDVLRTHRHMAESHRVTEIESDTE